MMVAENINTNILREGKFDQDLFEEPAMVFVDLYNAELNEASEDLLLGGDSDMNLIDIVMMGDKAMAQLDEDQPRYDIDYSPSPIKR